MLHPARTLVSYHHERVGWGEGATCGGHGMACPCWGWVKRLAVGQTTHGCRKGRGPHCTYRVRHHAPRPPPVLATVTGSRCEWVVGPAWGSWVSTSPPTWSGQPLGESQLRTTTHTHAALLPRCYVPMHTRWTLITCDSCECCGDIVGATRHPGTRRRHLGAVPCTDGRLSQAGGPLASRAAPTECATPAKAPTPSNTIPDTVHVCGCLRGAGAVGAR